MFDFLSVVAGYFQNDRATCFWQANNAKL